MMLRLAIVASSLAVSIATDYACFTGSSIYERTVKVCNLDMPVKNPANIDSSPNTWFCSVTSVKEMGKSVKRDPPYIWSCATPNQCNATCSDVDDDDSVPRCTGYYGNDEDNSEGTLLSTAGGVKVRTWCAKAINNAKKPNKLAWAPGTVLPAALALELPFFDTEEPETSAATRAGSPIWVVSLVVIGLGWALYI